MILRPGGCRAWRATVKSHGKHNRQNIVATGVWGKLVNLTPMFMNYCPISYGVIIYKNWSFLMQSKVEKMESLAEKGTETHYHEMSESKRWISLPN